MGRFADRVALVTGGSSGIGLSAALAFAREGARVAIAGRRAEAGSDALAAIEAAGGEAIFIQTDVTRAALLGCGLGHHGRVSAHRWRCIRGHARRRVAPGTRLQSHGTKQPGAEPCLEH